MPKSDLDRVAPAIITRFTDFWLLGGASILVWALMLIGQLMRSHSDAFENRFAQLIPFFGVLVVFCNNPHFMISYRFGYGRGLKFIQKNWFALVAVPIAMFAFFTTAYIGFETDISESGWVRALNSVFAWLHLSYRQGTLANFGMEALSASVLVMLLTVGWHYSKQVFGCMMVVARFDQYALSTNQKKLIKSSLFSVAIFNFFYYAIYSPDYSNGSTGQAYFFNIPLVSLGLPQFLIPLSGVIVYALALSVAYFVFYKNFKKKGKWPSANVLVSWIAFHVWWIPVFRQTEYYLIVVPFFHSLQYLPFAYRMEAPKIKRNSWRSWNISWKLGLLILVGFCVMEWIPIFLDQGLSTMASTRTVFFLVSFVVFINIHHYFIDSVVWKFNQAEVKDKLFQKTL